MELPQNAFKRAIREGRQQIGLWSSLASGYTVELIAGAGFDWILLDTEHSPNDLESVLTQAQAAAAYPTSTIARVPWNDMVAIKRFLDIGLQTLLIPYVCSVKEAQDAVAYTRYPPAGVRGVAGSTRATCFGRVEDYARRAHGIPASRQVETKAALDSSTPCAVEGVDGVFIGPADLHASMGYAGETSNPKVVPIIEEAMRRIAKCGKAPGVLAFPESDIRRYIAAGSLFTAVGADAGILARGADALAAKYRG
jgi:4-hydroxy-2-oxoheptanedioate aldolase